MPSFVKLTPTQVEDIRAHVKSLDFNTIEKLKRTKDDNGTFDVIISTEDLDRAGEIVRQDGWEMANYKNNPIVLWGHDYYNLPIGVCTETYKATYHGLPATGARGFFYPADINPLAQQVRRMYDFGVKSGMGVGCTTSVGFIPKEFDEDNQRIITRAELLEFSFVPIPANQGVGPAQGRAFTFEEAKELGLDMPALRAKGMFFSETLGYVPKNVSEEKAADGTSWSKPSLSDFTGKGWDELSTADKNHIAGHYAYSKNQPPESFGDLKLPHHEAKSGAVVWNGVKAAMAALMGARGGVDVEGDRKAVYDHLAAHYRQFEQEPPELKSLKAAEEGDSCTTDDGSSGVLTADPKDPDGALVCIPQDQDKEKAISRASQQKLLKAVADEHNRHGNEISKALEDFRDHAEAGKPEEAEKGRSKEPTPESRMREHLKDMRDAISDEHDMHRAKSLTGFRGFNPSEDKAFDKKKHLKSLRDEHDAYEARNNNALDEYETRMTKTAQGESGDSDENGDWITGKMDDSARAHKKAVVKIAKSMCREAYGEEEQPDEKTLEILKEFLSPHIDAQLLPAVISKVGARISRVTRERLREAHEHMKAASGIVEDLHGGLKDDDGEASRSIEGQELSGTAPRTQRSRPAESHDEELTKFLAQREIAREFATLAQRRLEQLNKKAKQ